MICLDNAAGEVPSILSPILKTASNLNFSICGRIRPLARYGLPPPGGMMVPT